MSLRIQAFVDLCETEEPNNHCVAKGSLSEHRAQQPNHSDDLPAGATVNHQNKTHCRANATKSQQVKNNSSHRLETNL